MMRQFDIIFHYFTNFDIHHNEDINMLEVNFWIKIVTKMHASLHFIFRFAIDLLVDL